MPSPNTKESRVYVTGVGTLTPIGLNYSDFTKNLFNGSCAIKTVEQFKSADLRCKTGAEIFGFVPHPRITPDKLQLMNRATQFFISATIEALENAKISNINSRGQIIIGGLNPAPGEDLYDSHKEFLDSGCRRSNPLNLLKFMPHAAVAHLSIMYGVRGPGYVIQSGCASATQAIGQCYENLKRGGVDWAITGGSDASFSLKTWREWEAIGAFSPDTCRPFSKERNGTSMGEGAVALILETEKQVEKRGATPLAEIVGYATNSDAFDLTKPNQDSVEQIYRATISNAGWEANMVEHINAHASGTKLNDYIEAAAIQKIFGKSVWVSGTKSMHGHLMTACGAIEAAATIAALQKNSIPPTINIGNQDEACPILISAKTVNVTKLQHAISMSLGFGGTNAGLAFQAVPTSK